MAYQFSPGSLNWLADLPSPPEPLAQRHGFQGDGGPGDQAIIAQYQQDVANYNNAVAAVKSQSPDAWNYAVQQGYINDQGESLKPLPQPSKQAPSGYQYVPVSYLQGGNTYVGTHGYLGQHSSAGDYVDPVLGPMALVSNPEAPPESFWEKWAPLIAPLSVIGGGLALEGLAGAGAGAGALTDSTLTGSIAEGLPGSGALTVPAEGAGYVAPSLGAEGPFIPGAGAVGDPSAAFGGTTLGDLTNAGAGSEGGTIGQPTPTPANPYADNPLFQGNPTAPVYQPGGTTIGDLSNTIGNQGTGGSSGTGTLNSPVVTPPTGASTGLFGIPGLTLGNLIQAGGALGAAAIGYHGINSAGNQLQQGITNAVAGATGILGGGGGGGGTGAPGGGIGAPGTTGAAGTPGGGATGLPGGTGTPYGSVPLGPNGYAGGTLGMWNPYVQAGYDALNRLGSRPASSLYDKFGTPIKPGPSLYDKFGQPIALPTLTLGQLARPKFTRGT